MERMDTQEKLDRLEINYDYLKEENKNLKEEIERMKTDTMYDMKDINSLYKENQKLKSDLAYERTMLDNVRAEYDSLQNVNKKLKEELSKYKKQYQHSMGFMEEDTLQELKDIGELGDDELIYEEGLYD